VGLWTVQVWCTTWGDPGRGQWEAVHGYMARDDALALAGRLRANGQRVRLVGRR